MTGYEIPSIEYGYACGGVVRGAAVGDGVHVGRVAVAAAVGQRYGVQPGHEKLARQQLTSELLGVTELNGLRAMSIGRSDSLEVSDIFQAQLNAGEKVAAEMERKLAAMPARARKPHCCCAVAAEEGGIPGHARRAVQVQGQRPHPGSGRPAR
jgi:hypothetical protein